MSELRLGVDKTYKLVVNGAFVRSESGRSYVVNDANGDFYANVAWGSRKDIRDAVVAARGAQPRWQAASAYNRGQVLYRLAEMAESRRDELAEHVGRAEGLTASEASDVVSRSIDRIVWYAGWTDKVAQVLGGSNPVAGPYFNFSVPTPTGVVAALAPHDSSLLGLTDVVFAPLCTGNTVVVVASEQRPIPAVLLGEMSATADFPAGVLNIVTGMSSELAPVLCSHEDVDAVDLSHAGENTDAWAGLAAQSIKRVYRSSPRDDDSSSLRRLRSFVEIATVWHTVGQ